ncbi:RNA polymerase-associated protein RapA [Silanimonas lenta]|uniref:RNA polymerase-associated protein RapA n=1 Tax=Silanimonas lenta TaxID=265429 RepID=UPI0003F73874|nr:RNA polymerase-associated protein RapA [Silanimonas lenta]
MPLVPGQRWFSSAEPELGLGTVLRIAGRSVQIVFTASGTVRQYSLEAAPLVRAVFRAGDRVRIDGRELTIEAVEERDGLVWYRAGSETFMEGQLDAEQPVSKADQRLISGRIDRNDQFERRVRALELRARARRHPGWGILGARIDLIPHQLRVIETAAARRTPRLLLADEVGLGKTIEACAIAAQQIASGRARRVLVLTPESLVNQWFVELLRRFNLPFAIYDEERCEALEMNEPSRNPFEDEQFVLASVDWLTEHDKRMKQVVQAGWDLLLVDEAHHLIWTPEFESPGYTLVAALAKRVPGLLLLTATPEQLGRGGHFARLRLLDPARYTDLAAFLAESERFVALSALAERLEAGETTAADLETLRGLFAAERPWLDATLAAIDAGDTAAREALLDALVDRHGTGRVMVRNRRAAVGGFPRRIAHIDLLPASDDPELLGRLRAEFAFEVGDLDEEPTHDYTRDPRLDWLLSTLESLGSEKVLVLCRSRAKVQALEEALRLRWGHPVARFHEDMNLLQRDRNAAFFADPEGARVLIASEVGAEGRNFQFAQHLVLWDLPLHPDMLEQRIGRLDRIGQPGDVHLHAAAVAGSAQEVLLRWYHEGLDAFRSVVPDGRELLRRHVDELVALAEADAAGREPAVEALLAATRQAHAELSEQIARGRDRLLERASQRADADELAAALAGDDADLASREAMLELLEAFGIQNEPLADERFLLDPEYLTVDGFEELKAGPREATFDRRLALSRDDLLYLRADHPMVLGAQDLLLGSETGNACLLIDETLPPRTALLEAVYVLECIADAALNIARFLPPMPLRAVVDTRLQRRHGFEPDADSRARAGDRQFDLSPMRKVLNSLVPPMLGACETAVRRDAAAIIAEAAEAADRRLSAEIARLEALAAVNPAVGEAEIAALKAEREAILAALPGARPRLDAVRLVTSPDFLLLRR